LVNLSAEASREEAAARVVGESSVVLRDALVDEGVVNAVGAQVLAGDGVGAGRELLARQAQDVALGDSSGIATDVVGANASNADATSTRVATRVAARVAAYADAANTAVNGSDAAMNVAREGTVNATYAADGAGMDTADAAMDTTNTAGMDTTDAAVRDAAKAAADATDEALVSLLLRRSEGRGS